MSKYDSLNTVVNTLTYLEVSSTNSRLSRMESQLNRDIMLAREQAYSQQRAIDQVYGFIKQYEKLREASDAGARFRYLQATLLSMDLERFDESDLPGLEDRRIFLDLQNGVESLRSALGEEIGDDGQKVVRDVIHLPGLIDTAKEEYVALEALNAARRAWLAGAWGTILVALALLTILAGAFLPSYWDTQFADLMGGDQSYTLAPMLAYGGLAVLIALIALRFFVRAGARKRIRRAAQAAGFQGVLPMKGAGASKTRFLSLVTQMRHLGADSGPYAYDRTTNKAMLAGIEGMEARLTAARDGLHSS
ncbi:hypothetical protein HNE_2862 [Hyphomonas neptunium ATCC 15444]|uniref:Uncharacterized protein n=2 Tax=Hyphomonas TaxID=85 RepID=Q0BYA3_HYPNA|nr:MULTISPECIES: hypothetical protein [Hyphomonas]ABI76170.1 hypothetical protein HNE_2862 [Hyphomonas neptunium ATCC 15444]KCZ88774.1 hypothetical protein HHI_14689 [Hyphomonas hirschiana VP5]